MSLVVDIEDMPEEDRTFFQTSEPPNTLHFAPEDGQVVDSIDVEGVFSRVGREVFFSGGVKTVLGLECSRCLEAFKMPVDAEVSVSFLPFSESSKEEEGDQELRDSDIEVEFYRENKIDLAQPVYDQILLNLPFTRLCRPECLGLCSQCGANKNIEDCGCQEEGPVDPRLAVLKTLKDKLK